MEEMTSEWALETRISTALMGGKGTPGGRNRRNRAGRLRYANDVHELCGISHILSHIGGWKRWGHGRMWKLGRTNLESRTWHLLPCSLKLVLSCRTAFYKPWP